MNLKEPEYSKHQRLENKFIHFLFNFCIDKVVEFQKYSECMYVFESLYKCMSVCADFVQSSLQVKKCTQQNQAFKHSKSRKWARCSSRQLSVNNDATAKDDSNL